MFVNQIHDCSVISLTDLKGHVGYCHHLASGVGVGAVMVKKIEEIRRHTTESSQHNTFNNKNTLSVTQTCI
jgi:hypothetical protein